jgi:glutathione S-transferase
VFNTSLVNPTGKFPFIVHNGQLISDTTLIIDYLKFNYGDAVDIDQHLTDEQRAVSHAYISSNFS